MKLVKNELFIEKIWAKIAIGISFYRYKTKLAVGLKSGRNLTIGSSYRHWGFNSCYWITSRFNLDHQMHMKLTVACVLGDPTFIFFVVNGQGIRTYVQGGNNRKYAMRIFKCLIAFCFLNKRVL